jgi:hypothetical protein
MSVSGNGKWKVTPAMPATGAGHGFSFGDLHTMNLPGAPQAAAKPIRRCSLAAPDVRAEVKSRRNGDLRQQSHSSRFADQPGTSPFVDTSAFELSRWRGGRYRVYSLKRRWSLEELTVQRYDDVDISGDTSSTSMNINNYLIAQLLFLQ